MKLSKHDIGGELLSILTKGMYGDPKDALREYVQNGIDAGGNELFIRIRSTDISIIDNGNGMDGAKMRDAIRVGISNKNPKRSVGFMGIGIYSAFHLCDTLTIYSKVKNKNPNRLSFDFGSMRAMLDSQKEARIVSTRINQQIDLLTLLERNIEFVELQEEDYPKIGTRVELSGIENNFFKSLSKFEEVSEYLESVVPLPFSSDFSYGDTISKAIEAMCKKHDAVYKTISLTLDINGFEKPLFRPYKDQDFKPKRSLPPIFHEMKSHEGFLGLAWGCLNADRATISNGKVRGFIIKKHGFTIGERKDLLPYFGRATYFNRYVGEFIVVHPKLLPNGPRTDFEYSSLRTTFYAEVISAAVKFNNYANNYQETEKAEKDLSELIDYYNEVNNQLGFFEKNGDKLLEYHKNLTDLYDAFKSKVEKGRIIDKNKKSIADEILLKTKKLISEVRGFIDIKEGSKKTPKKTKEKAASSYVKPIVSSTSTTPKNLPDLLIMTGIEFSQEVRSVLELIDEKFLQGNSKSKEEYLNLLLELRNDIESIFES